MKYRLIAESRTTYFSSISSYCISIRVDDDDVSDVLENSRVENSTRVEVGEPITETSSKNRVNETK